MAFLITVLIVLTNEGRMDIKAAAGLSVDFTYIKPGKTINPRNLAPDFENAYESSNTSDDSKNDNHLESDTERPRFDEESKEYSYLNDQSTEEDVGQDMNHVAANDDPNKYAGLVSDAENDGGDDEYLSMDIIDTGMVQLPVPPEMRFDDRLLSSLGVPDAFLKELGSNGWSGLKPQMPYNYLQEPHQSRSPDSIRED
ncbi:hypothetical protein PHPALM_31202 [Phytophthora palmivora]|uniref:Uncharacterized protein n=1 Tax=Phytophthora palmivora TaxID=4796 RepID=A0A2P4X380_9STRA|nr:hypothetical protein PHPALM_31202 [Phytophthora palmivora]